MRLFLATSLAFIALLPPALPAAAQSARLIEFRPFLTRKETEVTATVGVRRSNLDFNKASDASGQATPNILSELTWEDVTVLELKGQVRHIEPIKAGFIRGGLHLEAEASLGVALAGDNRDSDYLADNRQNEFSRSDNDADEGYSVAGAVATGYQFTLLGPDREKAKRLLTSRQPSTYRGKMRRQRAMRELTDPAQTWLTVTPLVGYGWDQQEYKITEGLQTINTVGFPFPDQGTQLPDSNTEYVAEWHGPFVGLESEIRSGKSRLRLRGEYHDLNYYAEGFWRARLTFRQDPSFIHEADGDGFKLMAKYAYQLGTNYDLTVDAAYRQRNADGGTEKLNLADGTTANLRLNEVNEDSHALHMGVRYHW